MELISLLSFFNLKSLNNIKIIRKSFVGVENI